MKNYYLAHPFDSRKEMRQFQLQLQVKYGVKICNPFYDISRDDVIAIDEGRAGRYEKLDPEALVKRDIEAIRASDGVIAYVNGDLSYGTIMEMVYAGLLEKEIILLCTNGHESHPWLVYHADIIFTSKEELEDYLAKL